MAKGAFLGHRALSSVWGAFRRWQLHHEYAARREYYASVARARGLGYHEGDVVAAVRARIARRGYAPVRRSMGEVHTFAFIPNLGWHASLIPDLRVLGPVTVFDYAALGYRPAEFHCRDSRAVRRRRAMNDGVLPALRVAHGQRPVDWMFVYASGLEVRAETIRAIVDDLGIPVVNLCLDDKQSWTGPRLDGQRFGQVDIASAFDLSWTSASVACEWYLAEGARPLYMPPGFDAATHRPMALEQDIPVSFIGSAYGYRTAVVRYLEAHGIPVHAYGEGWRGAGWVDDAVAIVNRSRINLGMGGIGYSETLTNVKARDFEVPGTGGGVYATSFNSDLARHFVIGEEILCYRSREEMLEVIRYCLAHSDTARAIAQRARERCLREHRWLHRYARVCQVLGIFPEG